MTGTTSLTRRRFLAAGAAGGAAALLAGCGGSGSGKSGSHEITVWGGLPASHGPSDLVKAFEKANPGITVKYNSFVNDPTGNTKLDTALQAGIGIDVYFSYSIPGMSARIRNGAAADITSYVNKDSKLRDWATKTSGVFQSDDKFYSLPTTFETDFMFINKDWFEKSDVPIPTDWTVSEMRDMAQKLSTNKGRPQYGVFAPPDTARMKLGSNYWYKDDGKSSNFDNPAFAADWKLHRDMIVEKSVVPWTEVISQKAQVFNYQMLSNSQVSMLPSASWIMSHLIDLKNYPHDFVTTFAPLPKPDNAQTVYNPGGLNNWIMMNAKSAKKDEAWKFMQFWLTTGAKYMLKSGKIPAVPGVVSDDAAVDAIIGPNKKLFDVDAFRAAAIDRSTTFPVDTIVTAQDQIQQMETGQVNSYLVGEMSLNSLVKSVTSKANSYIKAGR